MTQSPEEQIAFLERMLAREPDLYGEYEWLLPGIPSKSGEHIVELCRQIQKDRAAACIDGVLVDAWTAAAIVQLADGLNDKNRAKFMQRRSVQSMGKLAQEVCCRAQLRTSGTSPSSSSS
jgi:hypothetical protein